MEKLNEYRGVYGRLHQFRDSLLEKGAELKSSAEAVLSGVIDARSYLPQQKTTADYPHVYRTKTRLELVRISAAVMGIEFSYAAETAFVSPTLLKIGLQHRHMTLVWGLSPIIGFFLTPLLGSLSDRCRLRLGRRRPFILLLSFGVLAGLLLVPNGSILGRELGDSPESHPWGVFFTVLGTVLLDFNADSCQSPARSYLLDVTLPEDHARGLSTFTIMAGLGGFVGYALGGTDWDATSIGRVFGGHVRAVFSLVTVLFVICVGCTVTAFSEVPLNVLESEKPFSDDSKYGATAHSRSEATPTLREYLLSIVFMPRSIRMVCLTNLFSWMAHVCYSLYFTDFVGEAVFGGDPKAPSGSESYRSYEAGVRFGCWGLSVYSLSCSCYSVIIEELIRRFRARNVYVGGLLCYCLGMTLMALTRHKIGVIIFSWTAGVMYSTLFTMPYLLIARYHSTGVFGLTADGNAKPTTHLRGLGTDVAIVSSMVFLAQFMLSLGMGSVVSWSGTTTSVVAVASFLAFCGAVSATRIMYINL